ncbi:malate synthase A [Humibacter antri]
MNTIDNHEPRIEVTAPPGDRYDEILSPGALGFLAELHDRFAARRHELLADRMRRRADIANGRDPQFMPETAWIRDDPTWRVAGAGPGLEDRRVEITGPTDRKMTINALNSGAKVWLADQEDATSPTWANVIEGQLSLFDTLRGAIGYISPEGKQYRVTTEHTPTIVMRPRGWHLCEKNLGFIDRQGRSLPASGSLVDFGLYFWHNAQRLVDAGRGPYFYLPKIEHHDEARLWNEVFRFAQERVGMPVSTVRATVLIETLPAAFQMEEILYQLREHCAGLNAGRWDYLFSVIKTYRSRGRAHVLPDRSQLTMTVPFMRAYTELLISTCHRRGAYAIGGMSAFIPNRRDPAVTERALAKVSEDKRREARDGFDGTWVAHPDLIATAQAEFDAVLGDTPHQLQRTREEVRVQASDLLDFSGAGGGVTLAGVRDDISVTLRYIEAWLRGTGAVAIDNLMEDAATAEIARSQLWQWIENQVVTSEGVLVDVPLIHKLRDEILVELPRTPEDRFDEASDVLERVALRPEYPAFLTVVAYTRYLDERGSAEAATEAAREHSPVPAPREAAAVAA